MYAVHNVGGFVPADQMLIPFSLVIVKSTVLKHVLKFIGRLL